MNKPFFQQVFSSGPSKTKQRVISKTSGANFFFFLSNGSARHFLVTLTRSSKERAHFTHFRSLHLFSIYVSKYAYRSSNDIQLISRYLSYSNHVPILSIHDEQYFSFSLMKNKKKLKERRGKIEYFLPSYFI